MGCNILQLLQSFPPLQVLYNQSHQVWVHNPKGKRRFNFSMNNMPTKYVHVINGSYHQESTSVTIGSVHPSPICVNAPCDCGRSCTRIRNNFFSFLFIYQFNLIWSDTGWNKPQISTIWAEINVLKMKKKKKLKTKNFCNIL